MMLAASPVGRRLSVRICCLSPVVFAEDVFRLLLVYTCNTDLKFGNKTHILYMLDLHRCCKT